jgi:hypothetical protein
MVRVRAGLGSGLDKTLVKSDGGAGRASRSAADGAQQLPIRARMRSPGFDPGRPRTVPVLSADRVQGLCDAADCTYAIMFATLRGLVEHFAPDAEMG